MSIVLSPRFRPSVLAALALLSWPSAQSQQPATLKLASRIVVLDVVVTDRNGQVVPNLTQQDFTILQDGKPQPIRHFEPWTPTDTPAHSSIPPIAVAGSVSLDAPATVYVLDELNTPYEEQSYSAFTLRKYLQSQPSFLPVPAMLLTVSDKGLRILSNSTHDRNGLIGTLDKRPPAYPGQLANASNIELLSESFAVLRQIALAAEGSPAHKTLVWLGRGFPTIDSADLDKPGNDALQAAMRETVTLLTRTRITLYKVDPITTNARMAPTDLGTTLDLGSGMGDRSNIQPANESPLKGDFNFNQFVVQTGGQFFFGRNDLDRQIADSLDRSAHFYTLTYIPAADVTGDAYRSIRIRMRDPSLTAVTRQGFYSGAAPKPEPGAKDIGFDLKLAASSSMVYSGVGLQVLAVTSTRTGDAVTVSFATEDRTLNWTPQPAGDSESAKILAVLVALDADHKVQSSNTTSLTLAVKNPAQIRDGKLTTQCRIAIDAKTRSLRLLVRDSGGKIGALELPASAWEK